MDGLSLDNPELSWEAQVLEGLQSTLLDVLAQRKDIGVITGEVLVDSRPLLVSFQRSAGYCEQMDVHEGMSIVREALIFSTRLRQPMHTSYSGS